MHTLMYTYVCEYTGATKRRKLEDGLRARVSTMKQDTVPMLH